MYHTLNINIFITDKTLKENIILFLNIYLDTLKKKNLKKTTILYKNIDNKIKNYIGLNLEFLNYNDIIFKIIYKLIKLYNKSSFKEEILSRFIPIRKYHIENRISKRKKINNYVFKKYDSKIENKLYLSSLLSLIRKDKMPNNIGSKDIYLINYYIEKLFETHGIEKITKMNELEEIKHKIDNIKRNLKKKINNRYKNHKNHKDKETIIDYFNELSNNYIRFIIPNEEILVPKITYN